MKYSARQIIIILIFSIFVIACSSTSKGKIQLLDTSEEMQKEVSHYIAIGIPVQKARQIMEDSGFDCRDVKNNELAIDWRDRNGILLNQASVRGDFLWCGITHYYILGSRGWAVYILYKNEKVILINTSIGDQSP